MNKTLFLKILGIIGGLLVITGLFIPYVNVSGISQSLWKTYSSNKQIYLAIIIIIFGLIPIVLYTINKKTEFVYTSIGALGFFLIIQAVDAISNGTFGTLSFGFYSLLLGTVLMGIVTLIFGKASKINVLNEQISPVSNNISDPIEKKNIDSIYNQNLDNSLPVENKSPEIEEINQVNDNNSNESIDSLGEEIPEYQPENGVNPVVSEFTADINTQSAPTEVQPLDSTVPAAAPTEVQPLDSTVSAVAPTEAQPLDSTVSEVTPTEVQPLDSTVSEVTPTEVQPLDSTVPEVTPTEVQPLDSTVSEVSSTEIQPEATSMAENVIEPLFSGIEMQEPSTSDNSQQGDVIFDSPQQEISDISQGSQVDIFGQPK